MHDMFRVDFERFQTFGGIIAPLGHQVVPSDHRTVPYVDTGNSICIPSVATEEATEVQAVPVAAVDVSALGTSSTCVLGTDQLKSNAFGFGFVSNKKLSLRIRPTVDPAPHFLSLGQTCITNVGQVFHYDSPGSDGLGILDKFLGSDMHQMGSDLGFVVDHSPQEPSGVFGSFGLNLGSCPSDASTTVVEVASRKGKGLAVGGVCGGEYPLDARVNPDDATIRLRLRKIDLVAEDKIPILTLLAELGVLPCLDRGNSSIIDLDGLAPEAESFLVGEGKVPLPDDGHNLSSEDHGMPFLLGFLGQECRSYASEGRAGKLGRKTEILPDRVVVFGVKFQGVDLFGVMDNGGNPVTGGKVLGTELVEFCGLADLDFDCPDIHNNYSFSKSFENPSCESKIVKEREEVGSLTPTLKMSGFPLTNK